MLGEVPAGHINHGPGVFFRDDELIHISDSQKNPVDVVQPTLPLRQFPVVQESQQKRGGDGPHQNRLQQEWLCLPPLQNMAKNRRLQHESTHSPDRWRMKHLVNDEDQEEPTQPKAPVGPPGRQHPPVRNPDEEKAGDGVQEVSHQTQEEGGL